MVQGQIKRQNSGLPRMESIERIGSIPLVEVGLKTAEDLYGRIKNSNRLFGWYFKSAETALWTALDSIRPVFKLVNGPLGKIDNIMCKSLDVIEQRLPAAYLPPQMLYWNTKEYMSDHIIKPVQNSANSVIQFGSVVLQSPFTSYAADRIDGAITVADKYVDKYLPVDAQDQTDGNSDENTNEKGAIKAIHHGQRFSRKLTRRLTQRTIAEARALKKQSKEAIHILVYAAELIATDPKLALQRGRELWQYLSLDEPENQARPQTLEQLLVLLTRESARRVVHLINFGLHIFAKTPRIIYSTYREISHNILYITTSLPKLTQLSKINSVTSKERNIITAKIGRLYSEAQLYSTNALTQLAIFLSGRIEPEKITITPSRHQLPSRGVNNQVMNNINGVY